MFLREIMNKKIVTLPPEASIREAAQKMKTNGIGFLLVVNKGTVKGCVTDRDLTICLADGKDPSATKVGSIMNKNVVFAKPDTDIFEATRLMARKKVRRLPIMENSSLVGVVTTSDIAPVIETEVDNFLHLEEVYRH